MIVTWPDFVGRVDGKPRDAFVAANRETKLERYLNSTTVIMPSEMDDVFQEAEPVVVDGDLIEAAKENIQPLASGRRATTLSAIFSTPHAQRESKLAATRNRLRINIEIALEDDDGNPLEAYCQLVYWTLENYPQGHSAESGLLELLEEATRVLKDHRDGIWRADLRYLKLWVLYANYVEKPTVIYRFLLANEIGTTFASLYEEFAIVLERNGRYTSFFKIPVSSRR
jgi:Mad3/BUB1 homology region 1